MRPNDIGGRHRNRWLLVMILIITAFVMLAGAGLGVEDFMKRAEAQQTVCGTRDAFAERLEQQFGERPHSVAITGNGMIAEIFVSPVDRTWTMILTRPDGISCLYASGHAWEVIPAAVDDGEGA